MTFDETFSHLFEEEEADFFTGTAPEFPTREALQEFYANPQSKGVVDLCKLGVRAKALKAPSKDAKTLRWDDDDTSETESQISALESHAELPASLAAVEYSKQLATAGEAPMSLRTVSQTAGVSADRLATKPVSVMTLSQVGDNVKPNIPPTLVSLKTPTGIIDAQKKEERHQHTLSKPPTNVARLHERPAWARNLAAPDDDHVDSRDGAMIERGGKTYTLTPEQLEEKIQFAIDQRDKNIRRQEEHAEQRHWDKVSREREREERGLASRPVHGGEEKEHRRLKELEEENERLKKKDQAQTRLQELNQEASKLRREVYGGRGGQRGGRAAKRGGGKRYT